MIGLLPQQLRRHNDVVRFDFTDVELRQNIIPVDEAEQLVGGPTVQLSSFIGVDMRKRDILLGIHSGEYVTQKT